MSIQQYLDKIKNAVKGIEVRGAIHDAIKQTYDDASEGGDANMEVKLARGTFPNLNARLDNQDSKINDNIEQLSKKADVLSVESELENKVDKNGNEQVSWAMLDQSVKDNIVEGSIPIVGEDSVNTTNVVDKAITYRKRTRIGEKASIIPGASGVLPDFDDTNVTLTFGSTFFITTGKQRYTINDGYVFDPQSIYPVSASVIILFNTETETFILRQSGDLETVPESCVYIGRFYRVSGEWYLDLVCEYTTNGKPRHLDVPVESDKRTELGEFATIIPGASGELPVFNPQNGNIDFSSTFFVMWRDQRYTVEGGRLFTPSQVYPSTSQIAIFFNTKTKEFTYVQPSNMQLVTENSVLVSLAYYFNSENRWHLTINCDYNITDQSQDEEEKEYQFSVEKLSGDYPEIELPGVGEQGNPFDVVNDDHNLVYSLFDEIMNNDPYVTREEIGRSTNDIPIYNYIRRPPIAPITAGPKLKPYPKILMNSSIHGGENIATHTLYFFFKILCDETYESETLDYLRNYVNFSIVPLPNPEDFNTKSYNFGIDDTNLNRNFDFEWVQGPHTGSAPFSRIEAQVFRDFLIANDDALLFVDIHARGNVVTDDSETMWLGSSNIRETPILTNTIEKLTRKWKNKYTQLQSVDGMLGHITTRDASGTVKSYAHHVVGIPSILWEGFKGTPTFTQPNNSDVTTMNVQFLGETIYSAIKNYQ